MKPRTNPIISLFILVLFLCLTIIPVSAHGVEPVEASPAEGEVLSQSPDQVRLVFSEEITEEGSSLQVFNQQDEQVDNEDGGVDLNDPEHAVLDASLPTLPEGSYLVKWKVTLTDGDSSEGQYYFGIGNVTLPELLPETDEEHEEPTDSTNPYSYWLIGAGILVIVGIAAYLFLRRRVK